VEHVCKTQLFGSSTGGNAHTINRLRVLATDGVYNSVHATIHESEMVLFSECTQWCVHMMLDTADIVRDGDVTTVAR